MGIYEFECEHGHVTEAHYALADRPSHIKCEHKHEVTGAECALHAVYVMSATPTTFRANDRKAFKRSGR